MQLEGKQKMTESDMEILLSADENSGDVQKIIVPIDDEMDTVKSDSPNTVDELAMELATIKQSAKKSQLSEAVIFLSHISK